MSKCTTEVALRGILTVVIAVALQATAFAQSSARLATYDHAKETHFALSIAPSVESSGETASDVVIYVDTSASQSGAFKRDSIAAVKQILRNLSADDRVKIMAVDLDPVALTPEFTSPASREVGDALKALNKRVALGTTDLEAMLNQAATQFGDSKNKKNVIYIGDGVSADNLFETNEFENVVSKLIDNQVTVSSFAIGPERNVEIMAALANHTGGTVLVDSSADGTVKEVAVTLAKTVQGSVLWPTDGKMDDSVVEMFPARFPPLRLDRDTIVLGTIADRDALKLSITGILDGKKVSLDWEVEAEPANEEFAFLPGMIRDARNDRGLRLPTIGSAGLREFARARAEKSMQLSDLAQKALVSGDVQAAERLGQGAIANSLDPNATRKALVAMAPLYKVKEAAFSDQEDDPFAEPADQGSTENDAKSADADNGAMPAEPVLPAANDEPSADTQVANQPANGIFLQGADEDDEVQQLLKTRNARGTNILQDVDNMQEIVNQRATTKVRFEIEQANRELGTAPDLAINRLKSTLDTIRMAPDLYETNRQTLLATLETSLQSARRKKLEFDERVARRNQNIAITTELAERGARMQRNEDRLEKLIESFNALLVEGNYVDAVAVTEAAYEIAPHTPAVTAASEFGRLARNYDKELKLYREKQESFLLAMFEASKATVPYPGNPLMIFPDPDEWREKVLRRDKYKNFRLAGSENEEKILKALDLPAEFSYDETSWLEVKEDLEQKYGFNIVLTSSAEDDALTEDEVFTSNLSGIRLKNALRILLAEKNATFVVKDETLQIISLDEKDDPKWFVTDVYNVADLVAPRQNRGGGGLGGGLGGGGLGGGLGGGGLGGGLGGGGLGGGGLGGGLGGGQFCIQNSTTDVNFTDTPKNEVKSQPKAVNLNVDGKPVVAWQEFFADKFVDPADVRATVRKLMKDKQSTEVVSVIMGAIDSGQLQGWMYEALVVAMQVAGEDQQQIERALMSAVDLSTDPNDVLMAANYMAANGMKARSLKLLKSFSRGNPTRFEPFVIGLKTAQEINDIDALKWATIGVAEQEWPKHPEMVEKARFASKAVIKTLEANGKQAELAAYKKQLQQARERDCVIEVTWTGDADLDHSVFEPGGTVCSASQPRTVSGGIMMGDKFSPDKNHNGAITERYVLPKGFAGDYQLAIRRVWGEVTSGKVTVTITHHFNNPEREKSMTKQVKLGTYLAIVNFNLAQGRRTENLVDHEIQTYARERMELDRRAITQQLRKSRSSAAASEYFANQAAVDAQDLGGGLGNLVGNRNAVGYQPQITTIPEGANLQASASTADRLYVIVSPTPQFTQIAEVSTFNILSDADNAAGNAQNLGGGQGGGGLGGGGGGLGGGGGGFGGGGFGGGGF